MSKWEYACRGGTTTRYSFGDDASQLSDCGWWGGFTNGNAKNEQHAHAVGQKKPNAFGLYDMHGNVMEWCQDIYDEEAYRRFSALTLDPQVTTARGLRVLRGGSWINNPWSCYSTSRTGELPSSCDSWIGVRVVCEIR
jgi:formylglycine-generating enzyme required for sulfatase activity